MKDSYRVEVPDKVKLDIIDEYITSIKDTLLRGKRFYIKGIGNLDPKFRKVKNDSGRNFTVTVRLRQDAEFQKDLISSCIDDPDKFS